MTWKALLPEILSANGYDRGSAGYWSKMSLSGNSSRVVFDNGGLKFELTNPTGSTVATEHLMEPKTSIEVLESHIAGFVAVSKAFTGGYHPFPMEVTE